MRYLAAVAFVSAAGVAAYFISNWLPNHDDETSPLLPNKKLGWDIQIIGWTSAVAYRVFLSYRVWVFHLPLSSTVGARLPQIG
jgi:hypothetical protein